MHNYKTTCLHIPFFSSTIVLFPFFLNSLFFLPTASDSFKHLTSFVLYRETRGEVVLRAHNSIHARCRRRVFSLLRIKKKRKKKVLSTLCFFLKVCRCIFSCILVLSLLGSILSLLVFCRAVRGDSVKKTTKVERKENRRFFFFSSVFYLIFVLVYTSPLLFL